VLDGESDFTGEFAEDFAFFGINARLAPFDFGPFVVTCHGRE
jgi:hypothetical protein